MWIVPPPDIAVALSHGHPSAALRQALSRRSTLGGMGFLAEHSCCGLHRNAKIELIMQQETVKKNFHGLWESCLRVGFSTPVRGRWGRCVGWPPDWGGLAGGPGPLRGQRRVAFGVGNAWSLFPRDGRRALRSVVLMALTRGRLFARARILCEVRAVDS